MSPSSILSWHRSLTALLVALLLGATSGGAVGGAQDEPAALRARPAGVPMPKMPGIERDGEVVAPAPGSIARDGALADRFLAAGQRVRYAFEAQAGELSLFELAVAGFARGWQAGAGLRVLDAEGRVLAERTLEGGVVFRPFLAFVAPGAGEYQVEVSAEREFFRYALVRHASYAARGADEVLAVGERERVHGWIADGADTMRFEIPVRAGEELALSVEGSREEARQEKRLRMASGGAMADRMMEGRMRGGRDGRAPNKQFPELRLQLADEGAALDRSATFARLLPQADGRVEVTVTGLPGDQGGLFDLVLRRAVPKHRVHGLVVDADDELLAGVTLVFRLEPDLEPWGTVTTDAGGAYALELPAGDFVVDLRRPEAAPHEPLKAGVDGETELNVIW